MSASLDQGVVGSDTPHHPPLITDCQAILERDYPEIWREYERTRARYHRSLPGYEEYERAKQDLSVAGYKVLRVARVLGMRALVDADSA